MDMRAGQEGTTARSGPGRQIDPFGQPNYLDEDQVVGVGEYRVARGFANLVCIGLGSCVGIAIFDPQAQVGGLAHAMLPRYEEGRDKINASKYADSAIMIMVDELVAMGAMKGRLRAKMAGGAQMFSFISSDTLNIGQRNSEAARATLKGENITLLAEDVGGTKGRTVTFTAGEGTYRIQKGSERSRL
ncbi:MAG: chemotaxis protein CheD [Methanomassiliicoccus sp.]|nr:chemotaxis protein CheD [Methanomassiliicoccus sp.]